MREYFKKINYLVFALLFSVSLSCGTLAESLDTNGDIPLETAKTELIDSEKESLNIPAINEKPSLLDKDQDIEAGDNLNTYLQEYIDESEDRVSNEEELEIWLNENADTGGEVTLTDNITITNYITIYGDIEHIVINTGEYGLTYNGGLISIDDFTIVGEGVNCPVLEVSGTDLYWKNIVQPLKIVAEGKDGIGGIALKISEVDDVLIEMSYIAEEGEICSYGTNAIGVYLEESTDVYCLNVDVKGDGATAVYAPNGVELYYCKLKAQGENSNIVRGQGKIVLNSCYSMPLVENSLTVEVNNYYITNIIGRSFYIPVKQNSNYGYYYSYDYKFRLSNENGSLILKETLDVSWSPDIHDINTSEIGYQKLKGSFDPPFQGLGLEKELPLELIVEVRDPSIPCIREIKFFDKIIGKYAILYFWEDYYVESGDITLWRSNDNGESWYDYTYAEGIEWNGNYLIYFYEEITSPIILQIEVLGKGESNLVFINSDEEAGGGLGGDRTGTDRVIEGQQKSEDEKNVGKDAEDGEESTPEYIKEKENIVSDTNEDDLNTAINSLKKISNKSFTESKVIEQSQVLIDAGENNVDGYIANNDIDETNIVTNEEDSFEGGSNDNTEEFAEEEIISVFEATDNNINLDMVDVTEEDAVSLNELENDDKELVLTEEAEKYSLPKDSVRESRLDKAIAITAVFSVVFSVLFLWRRFGKTKGGG